MKEQKRHCLKLPDSNKKITFLFLLYAPIRLLPSRSRSPYHTSHRFVYTISISPSVTSTFLTFPMLCIQLSYKTIQLRISISVQKSRNLYHCNQYNYNIYFKMLFPSVSIKLFSFSFNARSTKAYMYTREVAAVLLTNQQSDYGCNKQCHSHTRRNA